MKLKKHLQAIAFSILVLTFFSCGNKNEKTNSQNNEPKFEITGYYSMGGHDESYSMLVEVSEDGIYTAQFAEIEGMMPPPDMFDEIVNFKPMQDFELNTETMEFTSKNGNGKFENNDGIKVVFSDKKDFMDEALTMQRGE